jgi:hypothetical protein
MRRYLCVLAAISWIVLCLHQRTYAQCADPAGIFSSSINPASSCSSTNDSIPRTCNGIEVICKSMFGKQPDPERAWTPLTLADFEEGWFDPWIAPPGPSGGSRRQGWVNTFDAFFNRMVVGIASYSTNPSGKRNETVETLLYETPITRRYMFGVFIPFSDSLQNGSAPKLTAAADVTLENRFLFHETQDFTVSFNLNGRVPTGDAALGARRTSINPYLSFFKDIGKGFSIRGTGGIDTPLDSRPDGVTSTMIGQLGIGQTLTPHDVPLWGDFTYNVTTNVREYLGQTGTFVSVTPGLRTHLGRNFWLLGGVEIPLSNSTSFQERFTLILVKGF